MAVVGAASWRRQYFLTLCGVSAVILAATVFFPELRFLGLGRENNIAAWWSGSLLFVAGLHAFDGYRSYRNAGAASLARPWLIVSALLIALSLDEIGSIHERVGLRWPTWPFLLVVLATAAWAFARLWADPVERKRVPVMVIAFACFAAVAGQEYFIEHEFEWSGWARRFRTGIEEGTELVGMLLLIKATMRNSGGVFASADAGAAARPTFCLAHSIPGWALLAIVAIIPLAAVVTARLPDQGRGHPADWLAAMLFLLAAFASWRDFLSGASAPYRGRIGVGLLFLAASAATVQISAAWLNNLGELVFNLRLAALAVLLLGVAVFVWSREGWAEPRGAYAWLLVVYITSVFGLASDTLLTAYLLTGLVAVFAYCLAQPAVTDAAGRVVLSFRNPASVSGAE